MTNRAETSSPTASRFLATDDMACPPELLDLAASSAPKPFGFVRAIGEATLETARAAAAAKLAGILVVLKSYRPTARMVRLPRRLRFLAKGGLPVLPRVSFTLMCLWAAL